MANPKSPFGLRPIRTLGGHSWNGSGNPYWIPSTYNTSLFIGDPVIAVGDSNDIEIAGYQPGQLSEINLATAGDGQQITGVIVGFTDLVTADSPNYGLAGTNRIAMVCDYPGVVYEIRDDGTGTPSVDWVNWNANLVAGSGNTSTGASGWALDGGGSDGPDADASNQLLILGLGRGMENEMGDYAVWEVLINQLQAAPGNALGVA